MTECIKILVADDDVISRRLIERCLSQGGYTILTAGDGAEAIRLFHAHRPDMIVSDWMMPQVDGLGLLEHVRRSDRVAKPYFILLTVKWRAQDRVAGLDSGADDYLVKPFEADELLARVRAGIRVLDLKKSLEHTVAELEEKASLLEQDLRAAARAQKSLLPGRLPNLEGVSFDYVFLPCHFVSGDSLNVFRLTESQLGFYMLDVCGHGVQAVMLSVSIHRILTPEMNLNTPLKKPLPEAPYFRVCSPAEVIRILNTETALAQDDAFFTFFYAIYDHASRELRYSRAGHLPPLLLPSEGPVRPLLEGGLPIGIKPDAQWQEGAVELHPGDRLLVYSDGVVEARSPVRKAFGIEALQQHVESHRGLRLDRFLRSVVRAVRKFSRPNPFRDDFTLLALEIGSTRSAGRPKKSS